MKTLQTFFAAGLAIVALTGPASAPASAATDPHAGPAMNYHVVDARLATGGHFVTDGLNSLAADGLEVIIDLRQDPPADQKEKMAALGIRWIHVPVDWSKPQKADYPAFAKVLRAEREHKTLVQCAANYRASAMTYLFRRLEESVPEATARAEMEAAWTPNPIWQKYLESFAAEH